MVNTGTSQEETSDHAPAREETKVDRELERKRQGTKVE